LPQGFNKGSEDIQLVPAFAARLRVHKVLYALQGVFVIT
jgi:hypothetical protein